MNKDLPSVFKNMSNKKIDNNKRVFYSKYENEERVTVKEDHPSVVDDKIPFDDAVNVLFKDNLFIFNIPVQITTKDSSLHTKIVSKVGDHIMIEDGQEIELKDIVAIEIKNN